MVVGDRQERVPCTWVAGMLSLSGHRVLTLECECHLPLGPAPMCFRTAYTKFFQVFLINFRSSVKTFSAMSSPAFTSAPRKSATRVQRIALFFELEGCQHLNNLDVQDLCFV